MQLVVIRIGPLKDSNSLSVEDLIALTMETGKYGVSGMAMLDKANTDSYGNPESFCNYP